MRLGEDTIFRPEINMQIVDKTNLVIKWIENG